MYTLNAENASDIALDLFRFQAEHNPVYGNFVRHLGINPGSVTSLTDVPFLPISFFKTHSIKTGTWDTQTVFSSSGTTGMATSVHAVSDLDFYLRHSEKCFTESFGALSAYHIFALMPSYLERQGSSLIAMLDNFIRKTVSPLSGFYLYEHEKLALDLASAKKDGKKIILWGVSFALLDFMEKFPIDLHGGIVIETGGMKGRRKEMTRQELHEQLKEGFNVSSIHSEYGMTELLSQAYTHGGDRFYPPKYMKIMVRETTDPLQKGLFRGRGD